MLKLPGYQLGQQLYKGKRSWVFKATGLKNNQQVIIKVNSSQFPAPQELNKFRQDFALGTLFNSPYIAKYYAIEPFEQRLAIIKEDFDAVSLAEVIPPEGFEILEFLSVALKLVMGLGVIHEAHIIHKDIKPRNVLINPNLNLVKFIDFGLASYLDQQTFAPTSLEGTLAYISPEQTGRMNRGLDYRTDFYALGVTFYEMLTGHLPFKTINALELIHYHIAKTPPAPHQVKASIPRTLSNIVMKLLAKSPEERYQSDQGLKADLERCLAAEQSQGTIPRFALGRQDSLNPSQISQNLYHQDSQLNPLPDALAHDAHEPPQVSLKRESGKAQQLQENDSYSYEVDSHISSATDSTSDTVHISKADFLDLLTVIKASQAISSEINLERLLNAMMRIIIESAGAQKGFLILEQDGALYVDAAINLVTDQVELLQSTPVKNHPALAESIVRYVAKNGSPVVISDGANTNHFGEDTYLTTQKPKSILCIPVKHQDKALGLLYLENNLSTHAFTQARVEILQILVSQAAISLENAYLYRDLTQEIVERRRMEQALRNSEERLTLAMTATQLGIWDWDIAANTLTWSENIEAIFGIEPGFLTGSVQDYIDLIYPDDRDFVNQTVQQALKGNPDYHIEHRIINATNEIRWLEGFGRVFFNETGRATRMTGTVQDITSRKQAEESLRAYTNELERSNKELRAFAYVSSHDLQEPLRKIQTLGNRLRGKYQHVLDEQGQDYLERMESAAARMQALIHDLLAFSRVTNNRQSFNAADLTIAALEAISDLENYIQKVKGTVNLDTLPTIEADETQMRQLFQNLINNALKFHRPEQPPIVDIKGQVLQNSDGTGKICQITVTDNGIGFDEKYLDRIFTVFQRLHNRDTYEGTGVGLAICRKITDRHHGSITAKSIPNQGTTFILTLPIQQPNL